jgi:hypothetical protein
MKTVHLTVLLLDDFPISACHVVVPSFLRPDLPLINLAAIRGLST